MTNSWSLLAEVLEGTLDETFPIIKKDKSRESSFTNEGCEDDSNNKQR